MLTVNVDRDRKPDRSSARVPGYLISRVCPVYISCMFALPAIFSGILSRRHCGLSGKVRRVAPAHLSALQVSVERAGKAGDRPG
jgi:hypothetical protein